MLGTVSRFTIPVRRASLIGSPHFTCSLISLKARSARNEETFFSLGFPNSQVLLGKAWPKLEKTSSGQPQSLKYSIWPLLTFQPSEEIFSIAEEEQ